MNKRKGKQGKGKQEKLGKPPKPTTIFKAQAYEIINPYSWRNLFFNQFNIKWRGNICQSHKNSNDQICQEKKDEIKIIYSKTNINKKNGDWSWKIKKLKEMKLKK